MPRVNRLRNLSFKAISLCRRPASPGADIVVAKHLTTDEPLMLDSIRRAVTKAVRDVLRPKAPNAPFSSPLDGRADAEIDRLLKALDDEEEEGEEEEDEELREELGEGEEDEDDEGEEGGGEGEDTDAYDTGPYKYGEAGKTPNGEAPDKKAPVPAEKMAPSGANPPAPAAGSQSQSTEALMPAPGNGGNAEELIKSMPDEARAAIEALIEKSVTARISTEVTTAVAKAREDDQKTIATLKAETELAKAVADADAMFEGVPHDSTHLATVLQKASPEERGALEQVAKAYRALSATSVALEKTIGARTDMSKIDGTPEQKLDTLAKAIEKDEKVSYAKAYTLATERNPDLYREIVERDSRVPVRGVA